MTKELHLWNGHEVYWEHFLCYNPETNSGVKKVNSSTNKQDLLTKHNNLNQLKPNELCTVCFTPKPLHPVLDNAAALHCWRDNVSNNTEEQTTDP